MEKKTNPYATPSGTPKEGKDAEFFQWEREQYLNHLDTLPKEEKKKILEADRALANRMNS